MARKTRPHGQNRGVVKSREKKNTRPKATLIDTLTHTVRREILRRLHSDGVTVLSPTELGEALGMTVPAVDYHVKVLLKWAVIRLVREEKVRGATTYLYASLVADNPAVRAVLVFTEDEDQEVEAERQEEAETSGNGHN